MTSFNPDSDEYLLIQLQNYGLSTLLLSAVDYPNYEKLKSLSSDFKKYIEFVLKKPGSMAFNIYNYKLLNWRWNRSPNIYDSDSQISQLIKDMINTNNIANLNQIASIKSDMIKGDIINYNENNIKIGLVKGEDEFNILVLNMEGKDIAPPLPIYFGILVNTPVNYWNTYHDQLHFHLNIPVVFNKIIWDPEDYNNNHYLVGKVKYSKKDIKIVFPLTEDDWSNLNDLMKDNNQDFEDENLEDEIEELDLDEIGIELLIEEKRFIKNNLQRITTRFALAKNLDDLEIYSNKDELYNSYPQDQLTIFIPNDYNIQPETTEEIEEFDID
jgi:hypothetical protein